VRLRFIRSAHAGAHAAVYPPRPRDDKRINDLETEIASFLLEMAVKLSELNSIYGEKEAA
jgi:hypothetical protein